MQLSKFILADMQGILQDWDEFARSLAAADSLGRKQLRNHAEQILRTIARDMEREQSSAEEISKSKGHRDTAPRSPDSAAQEHGSGRLEEGFSMAEMVAEYRALRANVVRRWRSDGNLPEGALDQVTRFNEGIDQALSESVERFSKDLDRSRELFMGALGHDLRGPLQVIVNSADYLQRPETPERRHADMVGYVQDSAERMQRMIDDLLDVAQTKLGGRLPIKLAPADAAEVCRSVVAQVRALHQDRSIELDIEGDLTGKWDAARIEQLVTNLVSNAVQHGDPDKAVSVRAHGDAEKAQINVHNQGEPIPEQVRERIFEPLVRGQQVDPVRNDQGNMGLGLYIACTIARAHRGRIEVQSSRASGTTFSVSLPKSLGV